MKNDIILVAELGINANGSVDIAKQLIDIAAEAGCHYVKFQKRTIDVVYSPEELSSHRSSPWGLSTREQKEGLEFNVDQYHLIDKHCKALGIGWFVSCWDIQSLKLMNENFPDMPFVKVASALLTDKEFLNEIVKLNKPVILSTGMSTVDETFRAAAVLGNKLEYVLHCTSTYPTTPNEMNMLCISTLRDDLDKCGKFNVKAGFSNHYSGIVWAPIAVTLGAKMLEFHITPDRTMYGSDQAASLEHEGVKKLVSSIKLTQEMLGDGLKVVYDSERPIIKKLRKVNSV